MISEDIWFKLYASCVLVEGKMASLIYDLERNAFYEIQNSYFPILDMAKTMSIAEIKTQFTEEEKPVLDNFFDQFVREEIGFYTSEPACFPDIKLQWESPSLITNAVLVLNRSASFDVKVVIGQLEELGCRAVQIRILDDWSFDNILFLWNLFDDKRIHFVEIMVPWSQRENLDHIRQLLDVQPRVQRLILYGAPDDKVIENENGKCNAHIIMVRKDIRLDDREIIARDRFSANIQIFSEASHFNTGLNRKVCIDCNGDIKNYLSHATVFGNVHIHPLADVIRQNDFQARWYINNDNIESCRVCQYRYACINNSDIAHVDGLNVRMQICDYDPMNNVWAKHVPIETLSQ